MVFPDFAQFYGAIHSGRTPYDWQQRLADRAAKGDWPKWVVAPTGMGKTTAILIALWALARQIDSGAPRTMPQRIFHVIDRRTVINQAAEEVEKAASDINGATEGSVLYPVRKALETLLGPGDETAVITQAIHGQTPRGKDWMRATGAVIVSTTSHQFVSRLLFRGYGVSPAESPIHAGLVGVDSLVLLDEPQLSDPAVETVKTVQRMQGQVDATLGVPGLQLVILGATPSKSTSDMGDGDRMGIDPEREQGEEAQRRMTAARPMALVHTDKVADLDKVLKDVRGWAEDGQSVLVVANSVNDAQGLYLKLRKLLETTTKDPQKVIKLITSRFRPGDRNAPKFADGELPGVIVATQTVEVGVDLDADRLVTMIAPLDSLIQRIGRLNRAGRNPNAEGVIVIPKELTPAVVGPYDASEDGPLTATIELLEKEAVNGIVDMGYENTRRLLDPDDPNVDRYLSDGTRTPHLTAMHLDRLVYTRPRPVADFEPEPFIVGVDDNQRGGIQVDVIWRDKTDMETLALYPPLPGEKVTVPITVARALARGVAASTAEAAFSDLETPTPAVSGGKTVVTVWRDKEPTATNVNRLTPGDIVILPTDGNTEKAGYDPEIGVYASTREVVKEPQRVADIYDDALKVKRDNTPTGGKLTFFHKVDLGEDPDQADIAAALDSLRGDLLQGWFVAHPAIVDINPRGIAITAYRTGGTEKTERVGLDEHLRQVGEWAYRDALAAGLHPDLAEQAGVAGLLHDEGKRDTRWQKSHGGSDENVVAKSGFSNREVTRLAKLYGPPKGWRHEALSMLAARDAGYGDLIQHLIVTHHGHGRPAIAPVGDTETKHDAVLVSRADVFHRLNEEYTPWGLAYLEAVLRLADWRASANPATVDEVTFNRKAGRAIVDTTVAVEPRRFELNSIFGTAALGYMAALGALVVASETDQNATLRWEGGLPILESSETLDDLGKRMRQHSWMTKIIAADEDGGQSTIAESLLVDDQKVDAEKARSILETAIRDDNRFLMAVLDDAYTNIEHKNATKNKPESWRIPVNGGVLYANNSNAIAPLLDALKHTDLVSRAIGSNHDEPHTKEDRSLVKNNRKGGSALTTPDGGDNTSGAVMGSATVRRTLLPYAAFALGGFGSSPGVDPNSDREGTIGVLRAPTPTQAVTLKEMRALVWLSHQPWVESTRRFYKKSVNQQTYFHEI